MTNSNSSPNYQPSATADGGAQSASTSREIKFRAWDGHKMHDWHDLRGWFVSSLVRMVDNGWHFMQFIGAKDRSGKEIYEGDILVDPDNKLLDIVEYKINEWTEDGFATGYHFWTMAENYNVIGNIYENPELYDEYPELNDIGE